MTTLPYRKFTLIFVDSEGYGWSEDYWYTGAITVVTLQPFLNNLVAARMNLAAADTQLIRVRIQGDNSRDPIIYDYFGVSYAQGQITGTVNNPSNAVIFRLETPGVGYNRVFARGIPDDMVTGNTFTPSTPWISFFNIYKTYIFNSGFFNVTANVDNPQTPIAIATASPLDPKGIVITLATGSPAILAKKVRLSGFSILGYNGTKNITRGPTTAAPLEYLLGGAAPQQANPSTDSMFARPLLPLTGPVAYFFYEKLVQRKAGRPFGLQRGRARTMLSQRP